MSVFALVALAAGGRGGQVEFSASGTFSWIVPAGVTSIHAAVVGGSNNTETSIKQGATTLLSSSQAVAAGVRGGGDGGGKPGGNNTGGSGAGGYSGDGGVGGYHSDGPYNNGDPGSGGGGGGGRSASTEASRQHGGGVYLHGAGPSGAGGTTSAPAGHGSDLGEGVPRGAGRKYLSSTEHAGGNLRYTIAPIAVTPGESLTITVPAAPTGGDATTGGGVRIIWGAGRSYPDNAKDV